MTQGEVGELPPNVPFLFETVISFFGGAREALDPVLQALDGYCGLEADDHGKPTTPNHLVKNFAELPHDDQSRPIGACLRATANLGLVHLQSFRLLSLITVGTDALSVNATQANSTTLYDAIPGSVRDGLSDANSRIKSNDIEMELRLGSALSNRMETSGYVVDARV